MPCRSAAFAPLFAALAFTAGAASADISGFVTVEGSGDSRNADRRRLRAHPGRSRDAGRPSPPPTGASRWRPLRSGRSSSRRRFRTCESAPENFLIGGVPAADGDTGVDIRMAVLPAADDPAYVPVDVSECGACHFERYSQWSTSHHAYTAQNKWVLDLFSGTGTPGGAAGYVFKNTHDPGETGFCATCHAPMQDLQDPRPEGVPLDEATALERLAGGHLRRLPPDGLDRRDPHQRAQSPRQGDLPLPAGRPGREHLAVRLGADGRRHLLADAAVVLAAPPELPDLRRLPPVPQPDDRRARPEHLPRVAGVALRHAGTGLPHLPGLPHGDARGGRPELRVRRARPRERRAPRAHLHRLDPGDAVGEHRPHAPRSRDRPRAASACRARSTTSAPATTSPPASRCGTPSSGSPPRSAANRSPRSPARPSRSGARTTCRATSRATSPASRGRVSRRCSRGGSTARDRSCGRCCSSTPRASTP